MKENKPPIALPNGNWAPYSATPLGSSDTRITFTPINILNIDASTQAVSVTRKRKRKPKDSASSDARPAAEKKKKPFSDQMTTFKVSGYKKKGNIASPSLQPPVLSRFPLPLVPPTVNTAVQFTWQVGNTDVSGEVATIASSRGVKVGEEEDPAEGLFLENLPSLLAPLEWPAEQFSMASGRTPNN